MTQRDVFFNKLYDKAFLNRDIVLVSADMGAPSLDKFRKNLQLQYIDTGIAEQNAIMVASGMSMKDKIAFTYAISPFITIRALEQIRVEMGMMKIPINVIGVGTGYSYEDSGPTHHLVEDISLLKSIPNIVVYNITDNGMAFNIVDYFLNKKEPRYIRLERQELKQIFYDENDDFSIGYKVLLKSGIGKKTIISSGYMNHYIYDYCVENEIGLIDVYKYPINSDLFDVIKNENIVTVEEHIINGGLGSSILELLNDNNFNKNIQRIGIERNKAFCYVYGGREEIFKYQGIDLETINQIVEKY